MDKIELKPCPFCGGEAYIFETPTYHTRSHPYSIRCNLCDLFFGWDADRGKCGGLYETREEAAAAWNRRADDTGWIPVTESLPGYGEMVLCYISAWSGSFFGILLPDEIEGNKWIVLPSGFGPTEEVTHWRPLPAPPVEKEEESQ